MLECWCKLRKISMNEDDKMRNHTPLDSAFSFKNWKNEHFPRPSLPVVCLLPLLSGFCERRMSRNSIQLMTTTMAPHPPPLPPPKCCYDTEKPHVLCWQNNHPHDFSDTWMGPKFTTTACVYYLQKHMVKQKLAHCIRTLAISSLVIVNRSALLEYCVRKMWKVLSIRAKFSSATHRGHIVLANEKKEKNKIKLHASNGAQPKADFSLIEWISFLN